jgi:GNAT superfamily N-acetyltransferase
MMDRVHDAVAKNRTCMSLVLSPVSLAELESERHSHFSRLREGPELYIELLLRAGTAYLVTWKGQPAGYCLSSSDGMLAELEIARAFWVDRTALFAALVQQSGLRGARCFSFDSLLLTLCVEQAWPVRVEGALFRDLHDESGPVPSDTFEGLGLRPAVLDDMPFILEHREGVFESPEEVHEWVERGYVSVLERAATMLGVGLLTPVWSTRSEHDVGVMVHPDHRHRGYASYILRRLKRRCLDSGMRPTAGCALENVASARALTRAGFMSQHSLLAFQRPGALST